MSKVLVRLDRIQLCCRAPQGRKPPALEGFKVTADSFVRSQTTVKTYARVRRYKSTRNDTKLFWQYQPLAAWLKPWKITIVADDKTGLAYEDIENVLRHCRFYRFLVIEVAIDFSPFTRVNAEFVRRHVLFGKSRRAHRDNDQVLYWGARKSDKFVRCYYKETLDCFRVEVELHSKLLKREGITTLNEFDGLPDAIYPGHFHFVKVDWRRLKQHLRLRRDGRALFTGAKLRASSLSRLRRYLRRHRIPNLHRFLVPLGLNERVDRALTKWIRHFRDIS